eukprot:2055094-Rhodomonas_salina.1
MQEAKRAHWTAHPSHPDANGKKRKGNNTAREETAHCRNARSHSNPLGATHFSSSHLDAHPWSDRMRCFARCCEQARSVARPHGWLDVGMSADEMMACEKSKMPFGRGMRARAAAVRLRACRAGGAMQSEGASATLTCWSSIRR